MAGFDRTYRQQIIDEYLNETGRNSFVPADFLDWLKPQHDHRAWHIFWGKDDEEAAHQYRLALARKFVAGLRIVVHVSETVAVRIPAYISPMSERRAGGGYVHVDVAESDKVAELHRQAAADLERWLKRWRGVADHAGIKVDGVVGTIEALLAVTVKIDG